MTVEMDENVVRTMTSAERASFDDLVDQRIVRFDELTPTPNLVTSCEIPEYERDNFLYIGLNWTPHPPAIRQGDNFAMGIVRCEPGKGAGLHAHTTEEVFVVLSGEWEIYWGEEAQHSARLGVRDAISFPPPVFRGFRNVGDSEAYLLAVLGGGDPPLSVAHEAIERRLKVAADGT